jgi:hypothetical protein
MYNDLMAYLLSPECLHHFTVDANMANMDASVTYSPNLPKEVDDPEAWSGRCCRRRCALEERSALMFFLMKSTAKLLLLISQERGSAVDEGYNC